MESTRRDVGRALERIGSGGARSMGTLMLISVVLVVVAAACSSDGDDITADGPQDTEPTTSTTSSVPSSDDPATDVYDGPGTDSPFVGRTEAELRETYPLVRVVWQDGEPLATTMDFVPGRIDIAVEGDTVVGATVSCADGGAEVPEWQVQACDPKPDDGPTVWGKLIPGPGGTGLVLEPGFEADRYYAGMQIQPSAAQPAYVSGDATTIDELRAEDVVWVWTAGGCRESSPVQCDIGAITVERG